VDVGKSVSRVGGKAQLAAYRAVAGDLRLSYSQFQELEAFSRFGTRMDERTRQLLERGYRVREVLKQPPYDPLPVAQQIIVLLAVTHGFFDAIPLDRLSAVEPEYRRQICDRLPDLCQRLTAGQDLTAADQAALLQHLQALMATLPDNTHGNH
jgi:F-type H+-transporting ATPase subunit alpha